MFFLFFYFFFYDWTRLVRGLGPIRVVKGCPSLCKGERFVKGRLVRGLGPIRVEKCCPSLCKGERFVRTRRLEPRQIVIFTFFF